MSTGSQKKSLKRKFRRTLYHILTTLNDFDFSKLRPLYLLLILAGMALALSKLPTTETIQTGSQEMNHIASTIRTVVKEHSTADFPADVVALFQPGTISNSSDDTFPLGDETLYSFYITGEELYFLVEGVASTTSQNTNLYLDGIEYTYHKNRLPFGKVTDLAFSDGSIPADNTLYHIVSTEDIFALFHYISYRSLGIMKIYPKNEAGELLSDYQEVLLSETGAPLSVAAASLMAAGSRRIAETTAPSMVTVQDGFNLFDLVRSPNKMTLCILILLGTLCVLVWYIVPRLRRIRLWFRIYRIRSRKRSTHTLYIKKRFRGFRRI